MLSDNEKRFYARLGILIVGGAAAIYLTGKKARSVIVGITERPPMFIKPGLPFTKRSNVSWIGITIHHSATKSAAATYSVLMQRQLSTHFEVDFDGSIWQYVDPSDGLAWHATFMNSRHIGIDLTGPDPAHGGFTQAQTDSLEKLVRWLQVKYDMPALSQQTVHPWGYDSTINKSTPGYFAHANSNPQKPDPSLSASTTDSVWWDSFRSRFA